MAAVIDSPALTRLDPAPKVVILCGGLGTRLREETEFRPKPLVPVGRKPILWHIMKHFSAFGCRDFILALGYKGEMIKQYFADYDLYNNDLQIDLGSKRVELIEPCTDESDWRVSLIETGHESMTGGRLKRLQRHLAGETRFFFTYGDGVSNVDLAALLRFHCESECAVTVTGVRPLARFGELAVEGDRVVRFAEKPQADTDWINGGFFVMTPEIFDHLHDDATVLERAPLEAMAREGRMGVYRHTGFWRCMDTVRDMEALNELWDSGEAPWRTW